MGQPNWVKRLNKIEKCTGNSNFLLNANFDQIVESAQTSTKLDDFGDDSWLPYLKTSLESIEETGYETTLISLILKTQLLIRLRNRLYTVHRVTQNPSIKNEVVDAPIIITGLPRSGTTILFELLNQDENLRAPLGYETIQDPNETKGITSTNASRQEIAECIFDLNMDIAPNLRAMHDNRQDLPAECSEIMANVLTHPHPRFDQTGDYKSRVKGFMNDDRYQWHKIVLQILQHKTAKKTWLLKDLFHLHFLDLTFDTYPNARIVHTHRDPISVIPSLLSYLKTMGSIYPDYKIKDTQQAISFFEGGLRKSIEYRKNSASRKNQITDIYFSKLIRNPIQSIEDCYKSLGIELSYSTKNNISKYLRARPRNKYGKHSYKLSDFGLSESAIRDQFKFYTDYYDIQ